MLLNELMPVYDVVERHRTLVSAAPRVVFRAIREADLSGGPLTRLLLAARAIPAAAIAFARSPRAARAEWRTRRSEPARGMRLADFERAGFRIVAEREPEELLIGLLGKFWTARGGLCHDVTAADFAAGPPAGYALAGWSFSVAPGPDDRSELRTETRVWCAPDARAKFRAYWLLVRPGSGLIRRAMLRAIRRVAERQALAVLVVASCAFGVQAASPEHTPAELTGTWRGTSTCTDKVAAPACRDEVVVYDFLAGDKPGIVQWKADKIVNGKREPMGEIELAYDTAEACWIADLETPRGRFVWCLAVDGAHLAGTGWTMPGKKIVRKADARKD